MHNIDPDKTTIYIKTADGVTRIHEPFQSCAGQLAMTRTKPFPIIRYVFTTSPEQQKAFEAIRAKWMNGNG